MCTWAATAPPGVDAARLEGVMLRFLDFDLEAFGATSATFDMLQIYATRADDPTDLEGATLVATFQALSVAALRVGDDDFDAAARPGVGVWVDGAGNFVQTFQTGETLEITTRDPDSDRPIRGLAAVMPTTRIWRVCGEKEATVAPVRPAEARRRVSRAARDSARGGDWRGAARRGGGHLQR